MKRKLGWFLSIATMVLSVGCSETPSATAPIHPSTLKVEGNVNPLNVHNDKARLSWLANVEQQTAYQIHVAASEADLLAENPTLWDSGKVVSSISRNIPYLGKKLKSGDSAFWRVRVSRNCWRVECSYELGNGLIRQQ